ncbi:hypothetical protein ACE6H2_021822 [Prunus campanulata]
MVSSFSYHCSHGSSLPAIRCCIPYWINDANSHDSGQHLVLSQLVDFHFSLKTIVISKIRKLAKDGLQQTDKGVGLMNEILAAMDNVKYDRTPLTAEKPTLSNINLDIPVGSLVAVVGGTGEGKTSLVSAMLE